MCPTHKKWRETHLFPSFSIVFHLFPSFSIVFHLFPSFFISFHLFPSFSMTCKHRLTMTKVPLEIRCAFSVFPCAPSHDSKSWVDVFFNLLEMFFEFSADKILEAPFLKYGPFSVCDCFQQQQQQQQTGQQIPG